MLRLEPPIDRATRSVPRWPRLEKGPKKMTIVAGFPTPDAVVLAADSEEGGGISKSSVHKIAVIDKGNCKCLIGGAGHGDFIDLATQHADEQIPTNADLKVVRQKLEAIVTDIYAKRIDLYPDHQREDLAFDLLCALWSKKDGIPRLVRVRRSACLVRKTPEAIGIGTYLARYLMATLGDDSLNWPQAIRLAVYVIAQAKKYVSYCGGGTQVVILKSDGGVTEVPPILISQYELTTSLIVEDVAKILFYGTDPILTGMDGDKIKTAVESGIAAWAAQLPIKFATMSGLPLALMMAQSATTQASTENAQPDQSSSATSSSTDQT
jgi:20S proteasome alpha/beta subunit